jgi:hypothetical protein
MASRLTAQEVKGVYEKISNWGRWGAEDERGALNFITAEKRARAAKLVQSGDIVSLALPLSTKTTPDNPQPVTHMMLHAGPPGVASLDYFGMAPHGMAFTHLDALAMCSGKARCTTASATARSAVSARANARSTSRATA